MIGTNPVFTGGAYDVDQAIDRVQKAISETSVSGLLLVREDLQSELAVAAPTDTPIRNRLSRIEGNGSAHSWYKLVPTSQTEGSFIGTAPSNGFFAKGGLPTATQAAYKYMSAPYVCLGDLVEVTFFDQMARMLAHTPVMVCCKLRKFREHRIVRTTAILSQAA